MGDVHFEPPRQPPSPGRAPAGASRPRGTPERAAPRETAVTSGGQSPRRPSLPDGQPRPASTARPATTPQPQASTRRRELTVPRHTILLETRLEERVRRKSTGFLSGLGWWRGGWWLVLGRLVVGVWAGVACVVGLVHRVVHWLSPWVRVEAPGCQVTVATTLGVTGGCDRGGGNWWGWCWGVVCDLLCRVGVTSGGGWCGFSGGGWCSGCSVRVTGCLGWCVSRSVFRCARVVGGRRSAVANSYVTGDG